MSISEHYPSDLSAALQRADLTQHDLSLRTGIHSATISRLCRGLQPTAAQSEKIGEVFRTGRDGRVSVDAA